jgi:hypothetical protein
MTLTDAIRAIIDEIQRLGIEGFEDALSAVSGDLSCGERDDDLYADSVIDGIRWGARAAVIIELSGGAMLRVLMPGGVRITHEWGNADEADTQIKAALDALDGARVVAQGVGDD